MPTEAKVDSNGKVSFTNGFRMAIVLFTCLWTIIGAITAYAYVVVLPSLAENIISNDKKYMEAIQSNKVMVNRNEMFLTSIKEDLTEIKVLLRRTAPYERK